MTTSSTIQALFTFFAVVALLGFVAFSIKFLWEPVVRAVKQFWFKP